MVDPQPIRLWEWGSVDIPQLTASERSEIEDAVHRWQAEAALPHPPLSFEGARGERLCARQYVGVVESAGWTIEIYPKLDREVLENERGPDAAGAPLVMRDLLWMLEVSGYWDVAEADTADLAECDSPYHELFAYLLAKNLLTELRAGAAHAYETCEDDLPAVRGRIAIVEQVTRNWNRFDRLACVWDEFTTDTPLNRILKCACRVLGARVHSVGVRRLLMECGAILDDVSDLSVERALREAGQLRWSRVNDRFRRCYETAVRLLAGRSYRVGHGDADTFVFFLDMNSVFEAYVGAALRTRFPVRVDCQQTIGDLLREPSRMHQVPDFVWSHDGLCWVGDAKYKRLGGAGDGEESETLRSLSVADVRQLTVYAEIRRRMQELDDVPIAAVFYPVDRCASFCVDRVMAWNDGELLLVPVRVSRQGGLETAVPELGVSSRGGTIGS